MPRRIPDYLDAYKGWNDLASVGSFISIISALLFFYTVYDLLVLSKPSLRNNPWRYSIARSGPVDSSNYPVYISSMLTVSLVTESS
jgi:hypothetical protein